MTAWVMDVKKYFLKKEKSGFGSFF